MTWQRCSRVTLHRDWSWLVRKLRLTHRGLATCHTRRAPPRAAESAYLRGIHPRVTTFFPREAALMLEHTAPLSGSRLQSDEFGHTHCTHSFRLSAPVRMEPRKIENETAVIKKNTLWTIRRRQFFSRKTWIHAEPISVFLGDFSKGFIRNFTYSIHWIKEERNLKLPRNIFSQLKNDAPSFKLDFSFISALFHWFLEKFSLNQD